MFISTLADILQHIFYGAACFVLKTSDAKNLTLAKTKVKFIFIMHLIFFIYLKGIWATFEANQQKLNRAFQVNNSYKKKK